jgi:hypothetical protein
MTGSTPARGLRTRDNEAVEDAQRLVAERDKAVARSALLQAALEGRDDEIGEGDWVVLVLAHCCVERIGDMTHDGVPIIGISHEAIGDPGPTPIAWTEDVTIIKISEGRS